MNQSSQDRSNQPGKNQFLIRHFDGYGQFDCDWRLPKAGEAIWVESDKEGVRFSDPVALTDRGRTQILKRFALDQYAAEFPLDVVINTSPHDLLIARRRLEQKHKLAPIQEPVSDHSYEPATADLAA